MVRMGIGHRLRDAVNRFIPLEDILSTSREQLGRFVDSSRDYLRNDALVETPDVPVPVPVELRGPYNHASLRGVIYPLALIVSYLTVSCENPRNIPTAPTSVGPAYEQSVDDGPTGSPLPIEDQVQYAQLNQDFSTILTAGIPNLEQARSVIDSMVAFKEELDAKGLLAPWQKRYAAKAAGEGSGDGLHPEAPAIYDEDGTALEIDWNRSGMVDFEDLFLLGDWWGRDSRADLNGDGETTLEGDFFGVFVQQWAKRDQIAPLVKLVDVGQDSVTVNYTEPIIQQSLPYISLYKDGEIVEGVEAVLNNPFSVKPRHWGWRGPTTLAASTIDFDISNLGPGNYEVRIGEGVVDSAENEMTPYVHSFTIEPPDETPPTLEQISINAKIIDFNGGTTFVDSVDAENTLFMAKYSESGTFTNPDSVGVYTLDGTWVPDQTVIITDDGVSIDTNGQLAPSTQYCFKGGQFVDDAGNESENGFSVDIMTLPLPDTTAPYVESVNIGTSDVPVETSRLEAELSTGVA